MFSVCTGIGDCVQIDCTDVTVTGSTDFDLHLHLMAWGTIGHTFLTGEGDCSRTSGLHGDDCRENFADSALLCTKTAADTRFDDADAALGHFQSICQDTAYMEWNLCGADNGQSAECVQIGEGGEWFHHGLVVCFGVVGAFQHNIAGSKFSIQITKGKVTLGADISFWFCINWNQCFKIIFRMNNDWIVNRIGIVDECRKYLVGYFDELHRFLGSFQCFSTDNGNRVTGTADVRVQNQFVIRAEFRIGLTGSGVAAGRNIFISQHTGNARNQQSAADVDVLDHGMSVWAAQNLDNQCVLRDHIAGVNRFTADQADCVLLSYSRIDVVHLTASFCLCARYFLMALRWL